jgi:hypothetical protein
LPHKKAQLFNEDTSLQITKVHAAFFFKKNKFKSITTDSIPLFSRPHAQEMKAMYCTACPGAVLESYVMHCREAEVAEIKNHTIKKTEKITYIKNSDYVSRSLL